MKQVLDRLKACLDDPVLGRALCGVTEIPEARGVDVRERLSIYLSERYGLDVPPAKLQPITYSEALFVAEELLSGPTFGPRERSVGKKLFLQFISEFDDDVAFYSTYTFKIDPVKGTYVAKGTYILDNSFDLGLLLADAKRVGILWKGDED